MAVIRKDDRPHNLRHILVEDGRGRPGVVEDGGGQRGTADEKQRKTIEDGGRRRMTVWDGGGQQGTTGTTQFRPSWSLNLSYQANSGKDGTGQQNAVRPRLRFLLVGQI